MRPLCALGAGIFADRIRIEINNGHIAVEGPRLHVEKIRNALRDLSPKVTVAPEIQKLARVSLDRMMALTEGRPVTWPARFQDPKLNVPEASAAL